MTPSTRLWLLVLLPHLLLSAPVPAAPTLPGTGRLRVLFLGDRGHHAPAERCQDVLAEMHARGIELTYTERLADLDPEVLEPYDALLLYANIDVLPQPAEQALLEFVAGGKGLVAVHCASYCFRNSDAFVELVGAQFLRHGTGVFRTERLGDHPLTEGLAELESWDETYVHARHCEDRTVLAVRRDEEGAEPWTWVREHGAGRVFYTAWGHDGRTWSRPAFHDLLERGVRWAAGGEEGLRAPRPESPFTSSPSPVPVPAYGRGEYGDQDRMPDPLAPAESLARLALPGEVEARLFASEPLIARPIALAFDERGRAWVAETVDYPNERRDEGGGDRIVVLEDDDGDGTADRRTVFAEGLSIPTGLAHVWRPAPPSARRGGTRHLVVLQAPHTLLLTDHDGDDRADERRVLFSGWGTGDTHAGPSHLRLGADGWLWCTVGYSGFRGEVGGVQHGFGQGIVRFRPDGSALEYVAPTSNNTWGLCFSEELDVLASTANGNPSVHLVVPNRHYERVAGFAPRALPTIAESTLIHPVSANVRQVDYHGRFTAAAGHTLYTARRFPPRYWNRMAFVAEPTGNLVARLELEREGSSFVARDAWNLLASDDDWTSPVAVEVGPDGAVWVLDWYSYVVQHNPTPPGFENGPGNAYVTPLRDRERARIWRIVPRGEGSAPARSLAGAATSELVAALGDENLSWRLTAQRLLEGRDLGEQAPLLLEVLEQPRLDAIGNAPAALHALWSLERCGALGHEAFAVRAEDALVAALRSPAAALRRAALQVLPRDSFGRDLVLSTGPLEDPDARVRVEALLALAEMPPSETAGSRIAALLEEPGVERDRWLEDAATCAAARHDAGFLRAVLSASSLATGEGPDPGSAPAAEQEPVQLLQNPGAELEDPQRAGSPLAWWPRTYSGRAEHGWVEEGDGRCLEVRSTEGADSSWTTSVELDPAGRYRLSGRVRTEGVEGRCFGALLNVHEIQGEQNARTEAVRGTSDWTPVSIEFEASGHERVTINALFGGWGQATGRAWFDDVQLVRLAGPPLEGPLGRVFARVARHHGARGEAQGATALLAAAAGAAPEVSLALLEGLAAAWPEGRGIEGTPAELATLQALARRLDEASLAALLALTERWGQTDLLAREAGQVLEGLREELAEFMDVARRVAAAQQLVLLDDGPATRELVLAQLELGTEPELAGGLLEALASSRSPELGDALLAHFDRLAPLAQRQAVRVLRRRAPWTVALLDAVEAGTLPSSVVDAAGWHELARHPEPDIAARAARLSSAASEEGEALLARLAHVVDLPADAGRGRAVFDEHCMRCHVLDGRGERVGPELDGVGQRPRLDVLADVLDPSRSVETNYQLWTARTRDGLVFSGRMASETRTTIELLDSEGTSHLLERADLEVLQPSSVSLMPSGFEQQLGEQGLADLLEYLASLADH